MSSEGSSPPSSASIDIVRKRAAAAVARRLAQATRASQSPGKHKDDDDKDNGDDKAETRTRENRNQVSIRGNKRKWREQKQKQEEKKKKDDDEDDDSIDSDNDEARRKKKKKTKEDYNRLRRVLLHRGSSKRLSKEKLRLHVVQVQRNLESLRQRLEAWDAVQETQRWERAQVLQGRADEDSRLYREALEKAAAEPEESFCENAAGLKITRRYKPKRMPRRWDPQNWKLRGAARPAWEVYDFDTRYVDPHVLEFQHARERRARLENVLVTRRGQLGRLDKEATGAEAVLQDLCREYLSFWMQLALLKLEAKQYKAAREAFLQVLELEHVDPEHVPVTPARYRLMRMYIQCNKPSSARRLWEENFVATKSKDASAWIWYSAVLVEYVSCVLLQEEGSTRETLRDLLIRAVQTNVFCAFGIAYAKQAFHDSLEYTDALEDLFVAPGSVLEAIQYTFSEQWHIWESTEGALTWLQTEIQTALASNDTSDPLATGLRQWSVRLQQQEDEHRSKQKREKDEKEEEAEPAGDKENGMQGEKEEEEVADTQANETNDNGDDDDKMDDNSDDDDEENVDLLMYSGMFRTTMEMLEESKTF